MPKAQLDGHRVHAGLGPLAAVDLEDALEPAHQPIELGLPQQRPAGAALALVAGGDARARGPHPGVVGLASTAARGRLEALGHEPLEHLVDQRAPVAPGDAVGVGVRS